MLTLFSPTKLNLFLHIVGRRSDGYHLLQTVFQFLYFGDTLRFVLRQDAQIHLHSDLDFPSHKNLVWQAAQRLQEHTQTKQGIDIYLQKRGEGDYFKNLHLRTRFQRMVLQEHQENPKP